MTTEPTIWQRLSGMLGIREDQAEDALHSERVAKHVVTRRSFLGAAGALAGASVFSFASAASVGNEEAARLKAEFDKKPKRRGSTLTTFDALLKERYIDSDRIDSLLWDESPLLGMLEKRPPLVISAGVITISDAASYGVSLRGALT